MLKHAAARYSSVVLTQLYSNSIASLLRVVLLYKPSLAAALVNMLLSL